LSPLALRFLTIATSHRDVPLYSMRLAYAVLAFVYFITT